MAFTEFTQANADFSDAAHNIARQSVYPAFFGTSKINYENTSLYVSQEHQKRDAEQAVDRVCFVEVNNPMFKQPLKFTVQERFRRERFLSFQDITLTVWNNASNKPSELYKIEADYFVYGYFNGRFLLDCIIVNMADLKLKICHNEISFTQRSNLKQQDFIGIHFSQLQQAGVIVWRMPKKTVTLIK